MSYSYSFAVSPPTGISIDSVTGLITIDATAGAFTGDLSVQVTDGVTTIVRDIPTTLSTPATTPLISRIAESLARCGGFATIAIEQINPSRVITGGIVRSLFRVVPNNVSTVYSTTQDPISYVEIVSGGGS